MHHLTSITDRYNSNYINKMLLTPRKLYTNGVLLVFLFCILFSYRNIELRYLKKTGPFWYGPMSFYSNQQKNEKVSFDQSETSSLKLKGFKQTRRISLDSVMNLVPSYIDNETSNNFSGTSDEIPNAINESFLPKVNISRQANNYNDNIVNNHMPSVDNKEKSNMKLKDFKRGKRYRYYSGNSLIKMALSSEDNKRFADSTQKQKILSESANPTLEALKTGRDSYRRENSLIKMVLTSVEKESSNMKLGNSQHKQNTINEFSVIRPYADIKSSHLKLKGSRQTHNLSNNSVTNHMLSKEEKKLSYLKLKDSKKGRYNSYGRNSLVNMLLPSEYSKTSSKNSKEKQRLLNETTDLQLKGSEKGRDGNISGNSLIKMVLPIEFSQSVEIALKNSMHKQKLSSKISDLQLKGSGKGRENKKLIIMMLSSIDNDTLNLKVKDSMQKQKSFSKISVVKPLPLGTVTQVPSFQPRHCRLRNVKLFRSPRPLIGLLSFPGSGNTWLRHLIQQMTGIGTSSVYCDISLQKADFPYECIKERGKTIVVKTHHTQYLPQFQKVVLLVRNPYDAFLSLANFHKAGHIGLLNKTQLNKVFDEYFEESLFWFTSLFRNTTEQFKGSVHVMQYEKLQTDMKTELRRLATFLNANVTDRDIDCTYKHQEGNFHRQTPADKRVKLLRAVYDNNKLLRVREAARTAEKRIKEAYNTDIDLGGSVEELLFN